MRETNQCMSKVKALFCSKCFLEGGMGQRWGCGGWGGDQTDI